MELQGDNPPSHCYYFFDYSRFIDEVIKSLLRFEGEI